MIEKSYKHTQGHNKFSLTHWNPCINLVAMKSDGLELGIYETSFAWHLPSWVIDFFLKKT